MKKLTRLLLSAAVLLFCGFSLLYYLDRNASGISFKEGDTFTGMNVTDMEGNEKDISELSHAKKIVVLVWDKCAECKAGYENYQPLVSLYDNQGVDVIFIWRNDIPEDLGNSPLGSIKHYSTRDISRYSKWVPTYFFIDEKNTVSKITGDFQWVEEYLSREYKPNAQALKKWVGSRVIFFTLDGCSACAKAHKDAESKLDMGKVFVVGNGKGDKDSGDIQDRFSIYAHALNIQLFPAFVLLHNDEITVVDSVDNLLHLNVNVKKGSASPQVLPDTVP
jgi:hypothetical protein